MPTPANSITVTALSLVKAAMQELNALAGGETPSTDDQAWTLEKLQRLLDRYNADRTMVYNVKFTTFTLPTNVQPVTIGPGAMFDVNQRPVEIPSISLVLLTSAGTKTEIPLARRDDQWWAGQQVKDLTSTIPTDYYYSPDWPNGGICFWPIPTQINDVLIESRTVIGQITDYAQTFSMPPAYWDMIICELAITLAPSFGKEPSNTLLGMLRAAKKAVQGLNVASPTGITGDAGMPGVGRRGSDFNYYTALPSSNR